MKQAQQIIGITTVALVLTGVISLIFGLVAAGNSDWVGAGVCLIASALSFGLLLNAVLK